MKQNFNNFFNNKSNFETTKQQINDKISSIKETIKLTEEKIVYINKESEILNSHILAVDKMSTLVKKRL